MSGLIHGAGAETWDYFANHLGLAKDLLPVVSNPAAEISPFSTMQSKGKTPSIYNREGKIAGLARVDGKRWSEREATLEEIARWKTNPDYGICVQTRRVRAIDIDVPDHAKSDLIRNLLFDKLGAMPIRWRSDSGKQLLIFEMEGEWPKRVQFVDGGIVEWLGDGQQFVAFGRHSDGELYKWGGDKSRRNKPHEIPIFEREAVLEAFDELQRQLGTAEPRIARQRRRGESVALSVSDDVADWLNTHWEVFDVGPDEQLFIRCPFEGEHTSDSGPSSTAYFPAGTGGYQQGHFVCLHAHCAGRPDSDFKDATGYSIGQFDDLSVRGPAGAEAARAAPDAADHRDGPGDRASDGGSGPGASPDAPADTAEAQPWPSLFRDAKGKPEVSARNLMLSIRHPGMIKMHLAHDAFNDALLCRVSAFEPWRRFTDSDAVSIRVELEHRGFGAMGKELIRDCIAAVAVEHVMDSAQNWLSKLRWDGVSRVDRFAHEVWGWDDTPYAVAVSRYVWSALAGRVIQPGVRADMAPILIGLQGARKTTLIQMMAPDEEMYAEIRLDDKEDNMSRKLRGKLVGELEELRGLNSRELEEIKAFITRRKEAWIPKFKEFENYFWRRNLFFGTTNEMDILADPTGERRWLPGICGVIDVEKMIEWRDQYWAEGATLFAMDGVLWQDAERLAKAEHVKFKIVDRTWTNRIRQWLNDDDIKGENPLDKGYITVPEVLATVGIVPAQANRSAEIRAEKALLSMGFHRIIDPVEGVVYRREV